MRILGVDPGTLKTGVGILEFEGSVVRLVHGEVVRADPKSDLSVRLWQIFERLEELTGRYKPEVLALENVFFGKDVKAMVKIGEARACAMLAAAKYGMPVFEYPPARVKQSVTGNGCATKDQVQKMMQSLLKLRMRPHADSADAMAVAMCHWYMSKQGWTVKKSRSSEWTMADVIKIQKKIEDRKQRGE